MMPFPFTSAELYLAFSLIVPPDEARAVADAANRSRPVSELTGNEVTGWMITADTLMLLSIASPELEMKVASFIGQYGSTLDITEWIRQREVMRRAIESGDFQLE